MEWLLVRRCSHSQGPPWMSSQPPRLQGSLFSLPMSWGYQKTICCNNRNKHSARYTAKHFIAVDSLGDHLSNGSGMLLLCKDVDYVPCIAELLSLCPMCSQQRWPPVLWPTLCLFILLCRCFAFLTSHLLTASLISWATRGLLRKSLPMPTSHSVFPTSNSNAKSFRSYNKIFNNKSFSLSLYPFSLLNTHTHIYTVEAEIKLS